MRAPTDRVATNAGSERTALRVACVATPDAESHPFVELRGSGILPVDVDPADVLNGVIGHPAARSFALSSGATDSIRIVPASSTMKAAANPAGLLSGRRISARANAS